MSITLLAAVIFLLSLAGGLAPRLLSTRLTSAQLRDITGFASGLLLASAMMIVIPEGFHLAAEAATHDSEAASELVHEDEHDGHDDDDHDEAASHDEEGHGDEAFAFEPVILGATILAGFVAMLLLEGLGVGHAVHEEHHDHAEGHGHGHVHHPTSNGVLAVGLSVHALADGLAIGSAAVAGDAAFSFLVGLAVILHRVPAAFSLGMFTMHETENPSHATRSIMAFAAATPLAMLLSYLLLDNASDRLTALVLLFSAGTFVYVATVDTLPAIHNPETGRRSVLTVLAGALIFTLAMLVLDSIGLLDHGH